MLGEADETDAASVGDGDGIDPADADTDFDTGAAAPPIGTADSTAGVASGGNSGGGGTSGGGGGDDFDDLFPDTDAPAVKPRILDPRYHIELPKEGVSDSVFPYGVRAGFSYATGEWVGLPKPGEPDVVRPVLVQGPPKFDLVALDLDGTLMRSDKNVAMYDASAIKRAVRRGVKVVIATARPPRSSREVHEQLMLDTPLINYNGALIYDRPRKKFLQHEKLPAATARAMVKLAREIDPGVVVTIELLDRCYTDHDDPNHRTETNKKFKPDFVGPLDVPLENDITKLMFLAPGDRLKAVRAAIIKQFTGKAAFMESDEHVMQIVHPKVSKGRALARVAKALGIAPEKCLAIGDAPNDADMLRWAGKGCAVANAFGDARDAADVILVEGNDNEAVGHAIEDFVL